MSFFRRNEYKELIDSLRATIAGLEGKISALENENSQMQAILKSMAEGVIAVDKGTTIRSVNPTIEKIFDISANEVKGRFFLEAIRNNDLSELVNSVLEKGEFISRELSLLWPVQKTFQINASPIFDASTPLGINPERSPEPAEGRSRRIDGSTVSGCLLVMHDITEIRKLETIRSDFVANVSHELKTPLTSIKGFVETLLEGALEDKENNRHFLEIIQEHTNRLDSLVNDLLDLSYLESKEVSLEKKEVNIKSLADDILSGFNAQLKKKSVAVKNDLGSDLIINLDEEKIGQVLTNLIDNAIKFNRENGTMKMYSQDFGKEIKVFVEDSGIGIPPKDIPRIFERFYRVDKARSRQLGGTGLGLSIVKHIVELHGGSVGVESTEGMGSKFYFTLPK